MNIYFTSENVLKLIFLLVFHLIKFFTREREL